MERPEILKELKERGYDINEGEGSEYHAYRTAYLDDGYGHYFWADVAITVKGDEIVDIRVDGYNLSEVQEEMEKLAKECRLYNERDKCFLREFDEISEEEAELAGECTDCKYLDMIYLLLESLENGNY